MNITAELLSRMCDLKNFKLNLTTFWNHGDTPIFISHSIRPGLFGAAGSMENQIIIEPGMGIDISILNLRPYKPSHYSGEK
jgi:hypothetical protein